MEPKISRRDFLKSGGLAAAGIPLLGQHRSLQYAGGNRVLRIAHISDIHYVPFKQVTSKFVDALHDIHSLDPLPDVIFNTGDSIMDSLDCDKMCTEWLWDAFNQVMTAECSLPVYHGIGNHDVWGWAYQYTDPSIVNDPLFGKSMAIYKLNLPGRYYSFELAGWHFIMLDSTHIPEVAEPIHPYIGKLDEEQFTWLEHELRTNHKTPVCILSHIPILAACEFLDGDNATPDYWKVPAAWMHINAMRLRSLFMQHSNLKLCLSGHSHMVEDLTFTRVHYLNDGAVCGGWWGGAYMDFPAGYVIIDLFDDGTCTSEFRAY